ncbi:MAG TPA: FtsX-like permease family protein [Candidatus Angelobacter sp.]|nr:FtsX-like permease family protein [Candidatus Angelobacter sp.]
MSRRQLFLRLLVKAAWVRKDRALTALLSVTVVATIATAALTVYSDLDNKLSHEFRSFGANVVVSKQGGALTRDELSRIDSTLAARHLIVPVAYAIANGPNGARVVVGGTDVKAFRDLNSSWSVRDTGHHGTQVLMGSRAAEAFSRQGEAVKVSFNARQATLQPEGIFSSGTDDDSRIYLDQNEFSALTGVEPNTALVRVEGRPQEIEAAINTLRSSLPGLEIKPVRQITLAQTAVVSKTRAVVLAASAVIVTLIMLCMMVTLTSSVLERRKDFAVMKALGASNKTVNLLFTAEAALLAVAGAAAGFILGSGIAFWIGRANFDAAIFPQPGLLLPVFAGSMALALLASTAPLRILQRIQPAGILRGE